MLLTKRLGYNTFKLQSLDRPVIWFYSLLGKAGNYMASLPKPDIDPDEVRQTDEFHRHKKQRFWQIYFPMIITIGVLAAIMTLTILAIATNPDMNSKWASLILMISITVISIFALAIAALLIYISISLRKGIRATPTYTNMAKFYTDFLNTKVKAISEKITNPLIKISGWAQGAKTLFHQRKNRQ